MADYKELLRRAIEALPENNGAARRAVYEKARAALVGQLRAINPPLPARDITPHRLQLEDCIRQVEQEASEAVIAGMSGHERDGAAAAGLFRSQREPAMPPPGRRQAQPALAKPGRRAKPPLRAGREPASTPQPGATIEDIIAAANAEAPDPAEQRGREAGQAEPEGHAPSRSRCAPAPPPQRESREDEAGAGDRSRRLPPKPAAKTR